MNKVKIILIKQGINKSGVPYTHIYVRYSNSKGESDLKDFWLSENVARQLVTEEINEDDVVSLELSWDDYFRPMVENIIKEA